MSRSSLQIGIVLALVALYVAVAWHSVRMVNTLWDEQQDYTIALALLQDPLRGSAEDGSQARLPMYAAAAAFLLGGESLAAARLASISAGALTIVMTWVAGRRWFGSVPGLLAAGLLAISPYFIGFSRTAMTEGDATCPLTVLLALLALDVYLRRRDSRGILVLSAALGLAIAAKFFAVILVPALLLCDLLRRHGTNQRPRGTYRAPLAWIATAALLEFLAIGAAQTRLLPLSVGLWAVGAAAMLLASYWLLAREGGPWPALAAWPAIALFAFTISFAAFPAHVLEPAVIGELLHRSAHWDSTSPLARVVDAARLHGGVIALKLGVPLGLLSVAAMLWAGVRAWREGALRWIVIVAAFYVGLLLALPLRQTFYLMSVYPLLILVLAAFVAHVSSMLRDRPLWLSVWLSLLVVSHVWLVWGAVRLYPEFGWYGYETVGDRWLGEESRGYRSIVQVTNDGTEDALGWLVEHVPAEARVMSYLGDYHVVDAFTQRHPIPFTLIQAEKDPDSVPPSGSGEIDYLVVSLNNRLSGQDPLHGRDHTEVELVHTVWRGPARYRMPVVQIYRARPAVAR